MRKSLGNKRNEITEGHKRDIVKLYGAFKGGPKVKILRNEEFGYNRITVERPLKLNFSVDDDRLARLKEMGQFQALAESKKRKNAAMVSKEERDGRELQEKILTALETLSSGQVLKSQKTFEKKIDMALSDHSLDLKAPLYKAILDSLSERDETAETLVDSKGNPMPDPELRDYENVPLGEKIDEYMKREVLPYVSDAWVDETKTKVGYEISFNRYFYVYQPPRAVEDIERDLLKVEEEITLLLRVRR